MQSFFSPKGGLEKQNEREIKGKGKVKEKSKDKAKNPVVIESAEKVEAAIRKRAALSFEINRHKNALFAFRDLFEPGSDEALRVFAHHHAELAACYKEDCDHKGLYYAYQGFDALRKVNKKDNVDYLKLINLFNYYLEEFPTHRQDLSARDYHAAINATNKLLAYSYSDDLALAMACKHIGVMYAKKGEKEIALAYFLKATQQLSFAVKHVLEQDKKSLLRVLEMHYRGIKACFPSDSIEHKIFSCATLIFSSYLRISDDQRARVYESLLMPLLVEILKKKDDQLHQKIFLQQLEMLMMAYENNFFSPEGPFARKIIEGIVLPDNDIILPDYNLPAEPKKVFLQDKIAELRQKLRDFQIDDEVKMGHQAKAYRPC